ncbi:MAG: biotin-dependent carboxyltransferase family protein [Alphaproteobacteria bacterium]|nr:biotin-dependent carboxyltransferase family protein [Alphaproteobacteria bacterium]
MSTPVLRAVDPGPLATIQDGGRRLWQRYGVSPAGPADPPSHAIANLLVGNPRAAAAVEFTLIGGTWQVEATSVRLAVAGGSFPISVDGQAAPGRRSLTLRRGQSLTIGPADDAVRGYLAVAGGFALPAVLDSLATHVRSGLGGLDGRAIGRGAALPLGLDAAPESPDLALDARELPPRRLPLRIVLGPQDDQFFPAAIANLLDTDYTVTREADRMGCKLAGAPLPHRGGHNIISDGIATGSIQVPGSGQPILLLVDRQTTGGYPKIATVISADLGTAGQLRPGDRVRFARVTVAEAQGLARQARTGLDGLAARLSPVGPWDSNHLDAGRLLGLNLIGGVVSAGTAGENVDACQLET